MKRKAPKTILATEPLSRKVNLRLSETDYQHLAELRMVLHARSDSHALRMMVRMHWGTEQSAIRRLRRNPRQVELFGGRHG
jgi:hypothetical protein